MNWDHFIYFAAIALGCWLGAALWAFWAHKVPSKGVIGLSFAGMGVYAVFLVGFWITLGRPPLRTMGETRLWYAFFMSLAGLITYTLWEYRWILSFSTMMSAVFIALNCFKPEIHDQTMMPALQSFWFIPHVTIYMFSYALLACTFLLALVGLFRKKTVVLPAADRLCTAGLAFFTLGMLLGSLWAKEAWGDYWSWDPKETWAAITWLSYLVYLHLRKRPQTSQTILYLILILSFLFLQMCWYGVNLLPSAQGSVHNYS